MNARQARQEEGRKITNYDDLSETNNDEDDDGKVLRRQLRAAPACSGTERHLRS